MGGEWICANCRVELQLRGMSETPVINRDDLYKLSTLDLSAITFEGIIAWSDSKVARHSDNFLKIIQQLLSDDKLIYVPADDSGAGESVGTAPKTEKKLTKVKDVSITFKSFSDLKLPIEVELIRNLFRKFESEYNLRTASSSPLLYKANTSEIHSALLKLSHPSLQHQLDHFYQWFLDSFGNPDTIMGSTLSRSLLNSLHVLLK